MLVVAAANVPRRPCAVSSRMTSPTPSAATQPIFEIKPTRPETPLVDVMKGAARQEIKVLDHGFIALIDAMPRLVPEGQTAFLFDILRTAPPVPAVVEAMVADNRRLFEDVVAVGGVRYPIGAIPVSQAEWQQHFGSAWKDFEKAKKAYDPDNILAPGQGIF